MCNCTTVLMCSVSGECYTLGSNQFGQLGVSCSESDADDGRASCNRVSRLECHIVTHVACGDSFTVAVTKRMSAHLST